MLRTIIKASSNPGELVLDCFCGSGTTLQAAHELGRNWIGIDQSEQAINVARKRLAQIPRSLFYNEIEYDFLKQKTHNPEKL